MALHSITVDNAHFAHVLGVLADALDDSLLSESAVDCLKSMIDFCLGCELDLIPEIKKELIDFLRRRADQLEKGEI